MGACSAAQRGGDPTLKGGSGKLWLLKDVPLWVEGAGHMRGLCELG